MLKGVRGQRHAGAPRLAPDLIPVDLDAHRPHPRQHRHEIGIVGDAILGVAQGADDLIGADSTVGLGERGQRLARPNLEKNPLAALGQAPQPIGEMDRVAQMADPIGGVGRLGRCEVIAGAVGQDRDLRGVEGDGVQVVAKAGQDRFQHPRMGGDVDGNARGLDPRLGQTRRQIIECGLRARGHAEPRRIDRRDVEGLAQPGAQRLG